MQRAHSYIRGYCKRINMNHINYPEIMQATCTYAKFHYMLNSMKIKVQVSALINFESLFDRLIQSFFCNSWI